MMFRSVKQGREKNHAQIPRVGKGVIALGPQE